MAAEHQFHLSFPEWEREVFDSAKLFTVITVRGRGGRERLEFDNPRDAIAAARGKPRTVVYAVSPRGRSVVLDQACWPLWVARWRAAHEPLQRRG